MSNVTLDQANTIISVALTKGRELNLNPLTIIVLDARGLPKALQSEDGSSLLRHQICTGKAWGALGMGMGSRRLVDRAANNPAFNNSLTEMAGGKFVPVPGGVLVRDGGGDIVGAVGVTGDTSDNDEICAIAGIEAAGLKPDTGA